VRYFDKETAKHLVFLTNNLEIPALTIAKLYKSRWQGEPRRRGSARKVLIASHSDPPT
jgi:IS4 transposase